MSFEEFQVAAMAFSIAERKILAILNLHVAKVPPTKFQLNTTYGSGGEVKNVKS